MAQPTSTGWRTRFDHGDGKSESEGGSVAQAALDGDLAAQRLDQPAHQGQAHAGSLSEPDIEAVEDALEPLGLDAAPAVAHGELHELLHLLGGQQDFAFRGGEAQRVGQRLSRMERTARRSARTNDKIVVGADLDLNAFLRSLVAIAIAGLRATWPRGAGSPA